MVEFYRDIANQKGYPQLDKDYWKSAYKGDKQEVNTIFDANTNVALKDISVFLGQK